MTSLTPHFSFTFSGEVWKIKLEAGSGTLAIETRKASDRNTAFSSFNFNTGECHFKDLTLPGGWMFGLDDVKDGSILLHGFVSEKIPVRKGIIALDGITGAVKWEAHHLALQTVAETGLIVYDIALEPKRFMLISACDGSVIDRTLKNSAPHNQDICFPVISTLQNLPSALIDENIVGPIWALDYKTKKCFSFHLTSGGGFTQCLLIVVGGEIVVEDFLAKGIQKLNPEAFFMLHDHLFCIRNRNEIVSYLL